MNLQSLQDHDREMARRINNVIPGSPLPLWARAINPANQNHFNAVLDTKPVDPAGDVLAHVEANLRVAATKLTEGQNFETDAAAWEKRRDVAEACGLSAVAREANLVLQIIRK